ncbi:cytochrome P450 [Spirosoma rhododendri]|uniref:Cytochrome P450 n=1 Tax=Spirosoma rhododendri TaxID=2728024 RepID=A0A7L5DKF2_9BACT|nr:cytochrome P450 [Spirosoma rhododendri]QJD78954.1 cytochrome P450 [Spirosoma rhododendri]
MADQPPIPFHRGHFLFGSTFSLLRDSLGLLRQLQQQYGDQRVVRIKVGRRMITVLLKPEETKYVLQENNRNYGRGRSYKILREFLGDGLLTTDGDYWRRQRRLAQPAFHRQKLALLADTMIDEAVSWTSQLQRLDKTQPVDMSAALMEATLRIVTKTLFGSGLGDQTTRLSQALNDLNHIISQTVLNPLRLPNWVPTPANKSYINASGLVTDLITGIIRERRQSTGKHDDLLDMLLRATDEETGEGMTDAQLLSELVTLFTAGHETTAASMSWTLYLMATHPDVQARARAEALRTLGTRTRFSADDLRAMPYLTQIVNESLRLYPPAWAMSRLSLGPDQLGAYHLNADEGVLISPYLLHHDPASWPNPDQFDPNRFAPDRSADRHSYAFLPFGGGPRLCIGNQFALMEMVALLGQLLVTFELQPITSEPMLPRPLITLRSKQPIRLYLRDWPV